MGKTTKENSSEQAASIARCRSISRSSIMLKVCLYCEPRAHWRAALRLGVCRLIWSAFQSIYQPPTDQAVDNCQSRSGRVSKRINLEHSVAVTVGLGGNPEIQSRRINSLRLEVSINRDHFTASQFAPRRSIAPDSLGKIRVARCFCHPLFRQRRRSWI